MKKQFFRVKQLADQTFSRAGKTEALSDDLIIAEKRIEFLSKTCQNISKKISSTLLGLGQDASAREKRISKSQEYILAEILSESCNGDLDEILKHFLQECSKILKILANCSVDTDTRIETSVLLPLQQIIETDVPNIMKQKRYLTRLILDMDSAKNRYQAALKHTSGSNSAGNTTKAESIKDELEDIEMKVEQCRDSLACDMFQLLSKETILTNVLLAYIKLQQAAHRTALALLDDLVPELESEIDNSCMKPVFGLSLEEHLKLTGRKIAYPLELCVCVLLEVGMEEEGLFRIAGSASKMRRLKFGMDVNFITMDTAMEYRDVHVFSSVLKSYFRELPEPLLTYSLYDEWLACLRYCNDENKRLSALWTVLHKLPQPNYDNLRYFIKFLYILTQKQDLNKMSPQNLAIVIAPNLIWSPNVNNCNIGICRTLTIPERFMKARIANRDPHSFNFFFLLFEEWELYHTIEDENMNLANQYSSIVEYLVKYSDWFFPEEENFYISIEDVGYRTRGHVRSSSADLRSMIIEFSNSTETNSMKRSQSTTSLEEQIQNCPLPESPKPITRARKNKPAPVPPSVTVGAESSSISTHSVISTTGSSPSGKDKIDDSSLLSSTKKQLPNEICSIKEGSNISRQESFNYSDYYNRAETSLHENNDHNHKISKIKVISDQNVQSSADVTKLIPPDTLNKIIESKKQAKPVPAPRISLESQPRVTISEDFTPRKPVIPEKPTTLPRPFSCTFKSIKISDSSDIKSDEKNKGPSLEKAYLYSVDKQQVSFIDIAANSENNSALDTGQENSSPVKSGNNSLVFDDRNCGDKMTTSKVEIDRGQNSSHIRALSDGHNIDTSNSANLPQLRSFHRIQRPIPPPPPPPPLTTKPQSRPGSVSDSTNL